MNNPATAPNDSNDKENTMSKFDNIEPKDITIWINEVTHRIEAKVWAGDEFHEITFPVGRHLKLQEIINKLKEDLREPS